MRYQFCYRPKFWEQYNHPVVRDIAWMLFSPAIITPSDQTINNKPAISDSTAFINMVSAITFNNIIHWLDNIEQNSHTSIDSLLQRDTFKRLGLYCEALFETIATLGNENNAFALLLISRNIQIFKPNTKITLGELDFLAVDAQQKVHHIEMATKFYLLDNSHIKAPINTTLKKISRAFIGPNRADRLDIKLDRLLTHQLPIAHESDTYTQLSHQGFINKKIQQPSLLFLKGALFSYYKTLIPINAGVQITDETIWAHLGQHLQAIQQSEDKTRVTGTSKWVVLKKLDWLAGPKANTELFEEAFDTEEIFTLITEGEKPDYSPPILLQQLIKTASGIKKGKKLMVVKDDWPYFSI